MDRLKQISDYLKDKKRADHQEIAIALGLSPSSVAALLKLLESEGCVRLLDETKEDCVITDEGRRYLEHGFPEERALGKTIKEMDEEEKRIGIAWAKKLMAAQIKDGRLVGEMKESPHRRMLLERRCEDALIRRGLVKRVKKKRIVAEFVKDYTPKGVGRLTREHILSGAWRSARPYNIQAKGRPVKPGGRHPIGYFIERIKQIFLSMGFREMKGPYAGPAFWSFDALFLPQDHPARELMDTFYLEGKEEVPDELLRRVGEQHKRIWGIWDQEVPKQRLLRPHTTALSSKYLSKVKPPAKLFAVGRVFRNEAIDYKHLAEFHQVEGIIVWEKANFSHLLGILKEFYRKLGFDKIRVRPHYFPFTEPSLEIEVWFEDEWVELGGAGIFRPEVSLPLCGTYPVLAWGLSIERPLVLSMGLKDIRTLYR